jgi:Galactosyltransferase.
MKIDLTDLTFLILVRIDSIQRFENIKVVTDSLLKYFDTNIYVLEADSYNNDFLKSNLNRKIKYQFIEDKDPVLHKTKYYNYMTESVNTKYLSIWDTDAVVDKKAICDSMRHLREEADVAYPYNGLFYEVPEVIKRYYFKHRDIRILKRHVGKMKLLYERPLVGGAMIVKKDKYLRSGGESEEIYGWGNDDFIRYQRFQASNYNIYRTKEKLFHLCHPRGINSQFRNTFAKKVSDIELYKEEHRYALSNPKGTHLINEK